MMGGEVSPVRAGDRVQLGSIAGIVLRVQSPRRMLRVHGRADHPGLCLVRWDKDGAKHAGHWYEATVLTVVESVPSAMDRVRNGLRRVFHRK